MNELEELLYGESETAEEFLVREEQVNRRIVCAIVYVPSVQQCTDYHDHNH